MSTYELQAGPTTADRMTFSVFLAACVHALILFGIGFALPDSSWKDLPRTLDVVLATNFSATPPDKPDFKAQANQQGGGNSKTEKALRTANQAKVPSPDPKPVASPQGGHKQQQASTKKTLTSSKGQQEIPASIAQPEKELTPQPVQTAAMMQRALEIAALTAELEEIEQLEAKEPRRKVISPTAVAAIDAVWMNNWRKRIEKTGKANFPANINEVRELMLRVDINADGSLRLVKITQSSGDKKVDKAALSIVHRAQPFAPFSKEMKAEKDVYQIVSVWRFEPGKIFSTQAQ